MVNCCDEDRIKAMLKGIGGGVEGVGFIRSLLLFLHEREGKREGGKEVRRKGEEDRNSCKQRESSGRKQGQIHQQI